MTLFQGGTKLPSWPKISPIDGTVFQGCTLILLKIFRKVPEQLSDAVVIYREITLGGVQTPTHASWARAKGTNPPLKNSLTIPEIYAKMFGRLH